MSTNPNWLMNLYLGKDYFPFPLLFPLTHTCIDLLLVSKLFYTFTVSLVNILTKLPWIIPYFDEKYDLSVLTVSKFYFPAICFCQLMQLLIGLILQ